MYRDDFVLRHIRLFVQAIAKILGLVKDGDLSLALETIRVTFMDYLGMSLDDFVAYPDDRMKEFLYFGEMNVMGLNKAALAGNMLVNAGLVYRARGNEERAYECIEKAIRLLLEIMLAEEEDPEMPDFAPTINEILKEVELVKLQNETLVPLSFYFDRQQSYREAHEVVQSLLQRSPEDPDARNLAQSFYVYLADETDETLAQGGISRDVIRQALDILK